MPAPPCDPNCQCGKHVRTQQHNTRIGIAVAITAEAKGLDMTPRGIHKRINERRRARR